MQCHDEHRSPVYGCQSHSQSLQLVENTASFLALASDVSTRIDGDPADDEDALQGRAASGTALAQVAVVITRHIWNLACLLLLVSLTAMHGAAAPDTVAPPTTILADGLLNPSDVLDLDFRFTP